MEAWGCCAAEKKQKRYKKCGSLDVDPHHIMWINHNIATVREFMFCKVRVWKGYFCNWLRKNWPTLTSFPHWTTARYWIPPFLLALLEFQKNFSPINMSRLKSWSPPPLFKGEGRKLWESHCQRAIKIINKASASAKPGIQFLHVLLLTYVFVHIQNVTESEFLFLVKVSAKTARLEPIFASYLGQII